MNYEELFMMTQLFSGRKWNVWFHLRMAGGGRRDAPVGTATLEIHLLLVSKAGLYHNNVEDEEAARED